MSKTHAIPALLTEIEELHPIRSAGIVRLPELIGVPFTPRVRAIVDHPHFQRLRKVRQLSLAYLVYPGAVHTRFEHSLGVFETTIRYLTALLTNRRSAAHLSSVTKGEVESLLLAALLHDIGHYPFAHLLEDLYGEVADHIELVHPFLTGEIGELYPSLALGKGVEPLGEVIARFWPEADCDDICYFVSGQRSAEADDTLPSPIKNVLRSVLDGPVDSDKLDYLYRDSIHCGVPYGRFIDRDRFFQALTVADGRPDTIAIHEKGRICVELFAYARSAMFSEVYWHHASRAITAMLNRAIREIVSGDLSMSRQKLMDLMFARSDEEAVRWFADNGGEICSEIMEALDSRQPYKRLLVIHQPVLKSLFAMLDHIKWEMGQNSFDILHDRLVERINESGIFTDMLSSPLRPQDILIDVPHRRSALKDVPIIQEHSDRFAQESEPLNVWNGIGRDFERWVRKIRVFCHPKIQRGLLAATGSKRPDEKLTAHLINLLSECAWETRHRPYLQD